MQCKCPSRSTLKPTREKTAKKIEADEKARKKNQNSLQIKAVEENQRRRNTTFKPPKSNDFQNAADTRVWKAGKPQKSARISFASPDLLWRVLTQKRWELLKALCGAGPVSIREVARRAGRDVKAVHGDVTALLTAGIIDRMDDGRIVFPFEAVKVEFLLRAA